MVPREQECPDTGYAPIDEDHRRLLVLIRELIDAVNAAAPARAKLAMIDVEGQVAAHFAHEERLMKESTFPNLARHKEAHDTFVADLRKFGTAGFRRWTVGRLVEWFRFHVVANDVDLARLLRHWRK